MERARILPPYLADAVDMVRAVGVLAAHTIKSRRTGEILPVAPGEAEWNLNVLERLFEFFYVQPELLKQRRDHINEKLEAAGKPPLKAAASEERTEKT